MNTRLKKTTGLTIVALGLCTILMSQCKNRAPQGSSVAYQCDIVNEREGIIFEFRNNPFMFDTTAFMKISLNNDVRYCGKYRHAVFINFDSLDRKGCSIEVNIRKDGTEYFFSNKDVYQIFSAHCKINAVFTRDNTDNMVFIISAADIVRDANDAVTADTMAKTK